MREELTLYTSIGLLSTTLETAPVVGIFILADGNSLKLDLKDQYIKDSIEELQILIADGERSELEEHLEAILIVGMKNNQLDQFGNIKQN